MRLAPVPIAWFRDAEKAIELAGESSRTTHGASEAVDACRFFASLIVTAFQGASKEELLAAEQSRATSFSGRRSTQSAN